jgi:hypothetical protein
MIPVLVAAVLVTAAFARFALKRRCAGCRCRVCRRKPAGRPGPRRRLRAVLEPGAGWKTRVRYGLTWGEWAQRGHDRMPAGHPEWITGELRPAEEEWLDQMDEQMEGL